MNKNLIIGAALLGGGAYYAYKKGLFGGKKESNEEVIKENEKVIDDIAKEQQAQQKAKATATKVVNDVKQANNILNPKSYAGKVSYIQNEIHVTPDGVAGAVTNKAFAAIYGLDKGNISTGNIDYYVARVKARNTLAAIKAAAAAAAAKKASAVNVANDAKKFLELVNNGKYKATLKYDVKANAFVFDNLKKAFVNVNEAGTFPKNLSFGKGDFSTLPRGGYVMKKGANNKYFAFNPNDFLVTL